MCQKMQSTLILELSQNVSTLTEDCAYYPRQMVQKAELGNSGR